LNTRMLIRMLNCYSSLDLLASRYPGRTKGFPSPIFISFSHFRKLLPGFSSRPKRLDTDMPMTIPTESSVTAWLPACLCAS
jgi:hypothetical protein